MDSEYLKKFSKLSHEERSKIIKSGRPTPDLKYLQQRKGTKIIRTFKPAWYKRKEWLCGCITTNRLFCFPCLLFSVSSESVWVKDGYFDLNNLPNALSKHERSAAHYESQISLKTFRSTRIDLHIDKQKKFNIEIHNEKVKENRAILKKLIRATCFLIKQELAFCGDNEVNSPFLNHGNYVELLKYTAKFDEKLSQHLQNSSVFSGLPNKIQNDLIEAIGIVTENDIKEEITRAPFISIEMDEMGPTTEVSNTAHCSIILRYLLDCEIKETFIGFDTLIDRTAAGVTKCIFNSLEKYACAEKLVVHTYDGAMVMTSHLNGALAQIREKAPSALFTHCCAHKLNLVLFQSAKFIPECSTFFKTIEALASFFSQSPKQSRFLDEIVQKRTPKAAPTNWNSNSKLIQTVLQYHGDLCKLFYSINTSPLLWDSDTLVRSNWFYNWLTEDSTYFLLMVYDEIFIKTDTLFNILQTKMMDIPYCIGRINETMHLLEDLRKNFDDMNENFEEYCRESNLSESKFCAKGLSKEEKERIFGLILDDILKHIETRYRDFKNLQFISLVEGKKFQKFASQIDKNALESLEKNYGNFFNMIRLKSDLTGIYNSHLFRDKSYKELLVFIFQNGLEQTFPEAVKLLQLILTIPITTVFDEKSSILNRIKRFSRNRMTNEERLSSLALISIEKERFIKMEQSFTYNFYEKVTDIFAINKERGMEFMYK